MARSLGEFFVYLLAIVVATTYADQQLPYAVGDQCPRNGDGVLRYDIDPFSAIDPFTGEETVVTQVHKFLMTLTGGSSH